MKNNISNLIKKQLLREQTLSGEGTSDELASSIPDEKLKMIYRAQCLKKDLKLRPIQVGGRWALVFDSITTQPGYQGYIFAPVNDTHIIKVVFMKPKLGDSGQAIPDESTKIEKSFSCPALRKLVEDSLNSELYDFIKQYREQNPKSQIYSYGDKDVKSENKVNGKCKLVRMIDVVNKDKIGESRPDIVSLITPNIYVWQCAQTSESASLKTEINTFVNTYGYKLCTEDDLNKIKIGSTDIISVNLGNIIYCKVNDVSNADSEKLKNLADTIRKEATPKSKEFRKACQNGLKTYYDMAYYNLPVNTYLLNNIIKPSLLRCATYADEIGGIFSGDKFIELKRKIQNLGVRKNEYGQEIDWRLSETSKPSEPTYSQAPTRESKDVILKNIIKENLNELSESKKKSLIQEHNIIKQRFLIISESGKPKTKKQKEKFVDDLLNEIFYLKSQGFNETLINEQFFDFIKSMFGGFPGGLVQTLKERFAQFILEKIGMKPDGYLANIFIATIGEIPIGDYVNGKAFTCDYLSNAISKGVGEGIARKIQREEIGQGYFYDIVRNSLVDMFNHTEFGEKIEGLVGKLICPKLETIKSKFNLAGQTMKQKALS